MCTPGHVVRCELTCEGLSELDVEVRLHPTVQRHLHTQRPLPSNNQSPSSSPCLPLVIEYGHLADGDIRLRIEQQERHEHPVIEPTVTHQTAPNACPEPVPHIQTVSESLASRRPCDVFFRCELGEVSDRWL